MSPAETGVAIGMLALVACSGAISGTETAYFSLAPSRLEAIRADNRDRIGALLVDLLDRAPRLLLVILILNNVINIAYFALASWWAAQHDHTPAIAGTIAIAALVALIIFGEILPKVLASGRPEGYARVMAGPMWLVHTLLALPCVVIERLLGRFLDEEAAVGGVSAEELKMVIERSRDSGVVSELVHDRLIEIVDLSSTPAGGAMTHRIDVPAIRHQASHEEAVAALREQPGPYLLVTDEEDNCTGLLSAQALLKGGRPSKRMDKPLFIPEGAQLAQVLDLFKHSHRSAGVVVDEYGDTLGLLTLAHLANELQLGAASWRLPGLMALQAWEPLLEETDIAGCHTIGGFVAKLLGAVPQPGDRLLYHNLLFQVESVEGRRIRSIVVEKLNPQRARRITQGRMA